MMVNEIRGLIDAIVDLAVDKEHSEKLASNFFDELDDQFKVPTVSYAIFLIIAHTYEMIESQDENGAIFFKGLMLDCVKGLGEMNE